MKRLCIIPARSGSKRIPGKNMLDLNGTPLIGHSILAAIDSKQFDEIIVSTDDINISNFASTMKVMSDIRPVELADDKSTTIDVAIEYLQRNVNKDKYDTITVLLPTCPFRNANHIKEAFKLFNEIEDVPFLVSVAEYEFPIQLALQQKSSNLVECISTENYTIPRTQDFEKRFHPNGAIYIGKVVDFLAAKTFFKDSFISYKMDYFSSYDIDYPYQMKLAKLIAKNLKEFNVI
jgi:CMP-N,N'-diacetyllegionaminic acid synthase